MMKRLHIFMTLALALAVGKAAGAESTNLPLQQISSNLFQIGTVRLDKSKGTVQFPAQLNMTNGLVEYLLVTTKGKLHESVLKTETEPYHIQLALLLLGAKGLPSTAAVSDAPFHVNDTNRTHVP